MKNTLLKGGIEFLAVFLGIGLSFNVEEWREDAQIINRLKSDYLNILKDLKKRSSIFREDSAGTRECP